MSTSDSKMALFTISGQGFLNFDLEVYMDAVKKLLCQPQSEFIPLYKTRPHILKMRIFTLKQISAKWGTDLSFVVKGNIKAL